MGNVVLILGKSGTGKSSSLRGLDPKETVVFNVLKKRLPFKGSSSLYNAEHKNLFNIEDYDKIISYLNSIDKNAGYVRNVVIDDITYVMRKEYFKTAKVTGFNKFVDMGSHFQAIIQAAENVRDNLNIFLMMHCEEVVSDNVVVGYKASTIGKMIDSSYNPIEVVPVCLFSSVRYDENKQPVYGFYTHRCLEGTVEIPAKTPAGMFSEDFIPNDLGLVVKAMNEYYN